MNTNPEVTARRVSRARRLYEWHDGSSLDYMKPARRKLKRALRLFRLTKTPRHSGDDAGRAALEQDNG